MALQVPAGAPTRTRTWWRRIASVRATRWSTNAWTPGCSTRIGILTWRWSTQRRRRRKSSYESRFRIEGQSRPHCMCCLPFGSATPGPGGTVAWRAVIASDPAPRGMRIIAVSHTELGNDWLAVDGYVPVLFTENETNTQRLWGVANRSPYVKDGIGDACSMLRWRRSIQSGSALRLRSIRRGHSRGQTRTVRFHLRLAISGTNARTFSGLRPDLRHGASKRTTSRSDRAGRSISEDAPIHAAGARRNPMEQTVLLSSTSRNGSRSTAYCR